VVVLTVVFLALHLPYLPQSLEDADSINFAIGLHAFDVARHQPHPPGYPLFIAIARVVRLLAGSDVRALSLLSVVAGACGIAAIAAFARRVRAGWIGVALAVTAPLYWFTANRPLSDTTGLAAAVAVQALILSATTSRTLAVAAFCAALAIGLRSQVAWLTVPLLIATGFGIWDSGFGGIRIPNPKSRIPTAIAFFAGVALWAVPLVWLSGGPRAYWHAVFDQGAEDLSGIRMLWTTPTVRELASALYYAFVAPWAAWPLAATVLALAAIGVGVLWRRDRPALTLIAVAFGPYLLFDLLFQETFTSRYALPIVVPIALVAARGAAAMPVSAGTAVAIAAAMFGAHVGGTSLAAYARQPAPAFRLLDDMTRAQLAAPPVVGMDRREALDLRAPIKYRGGSFPNGATQLASPPQYEWSEVISYWTVTHRDRRRPVWFVADPKRTDIDLIQHGEPQRYRWSLPYPVLLDGVRPNEMDWYELDYPEWSVSRGWALSPEAAGVSVADNSGLSEGPIFGTVRADAANGVAMIGGRNFDERPASLSVLVGSFRRTFTVPAGAFLRLWTAPPSNPSAVPSDADVQLLVRTDPPARVAIEQFDASATRTLFGFADGWHEQEYNPDTGLSWRWTSARADLRIASARPPAALVLHLSGESPRKYFPRASSLVVRADGAVVFTAEIADDFSLTIPIPRPAAVLTLETDQTYVPAERSWRTRDRRPLGLRIFTCSVRGVSAPGR
jgi:hypothetical protein